MATLLHPDAPNFRSFCGMELPDGRRVRQGRFYRCASPRTFGPAGLEALEALDPYAIVDLRGREESTVNAYVLPDSIKDRRIALPIEPKTGDRVRELHEAGLLDRESAREAMRETYRYYVEDSAHVFHELLRLAHESGGRPVVWHCAAGKDRTGFAGAMILGTLGAAQEAVMADYLATNDLWAPPANSTVSAVPEAAREALRRVEVDYLQTALDTVAERYGSMSAFAAEALGGEDQVAIFVTDALEEPQPA